MTVAFPESPFEEGLAHADDEKSFYKRVNTKRRDALSDYLDGYVQGSSDCTILGGSSVAATGGAQAEPARRFTLPKWNWNVRGPRFSLRTIGLVALGVAVGTPALSYIAPTVADAMVSTALKVVPESAYERVAANAACALVTPVKDRTGETVTFLRTPGCEGTTYISAPVSDTGVAKLIPALSAIEGEIFGPGVIANVNLSGLARAVYSLGKVGGTNFLQSSIEVAAGRPHGLGVIDKIWLEFVVGAGFTANRLQTETAKQKFAVHNLQCAAGATGSSFGPALAGDHCAAIVGRDHLSDINDGEACFIAATIFKPLRIPGPGQDTAAYESQYNAIKTRAKDKCAPKLTSASLNEVTIEIDAIKAPRLEAIVASIRGAEQALPFAGRLFDEFGIKIDGNLVTTTLNATAQRAIVERAIAFGDKIANGLQPPLCWSETCGDNRADIAIATFEVRDGVSEVLAAYLSRRGLLAGPTEGLPHRSVGSLTKGLVVPFFLEAGINQLCRRKWANLHDSDGFAGGTCDGKTDMMSVADALAQSSNLAIADGLRKIDGPRFRTYLQKTGYAIHGDPSDAQLIRSAITGDNVAAPPTVVVRNYAGIVFAPTGATLPTIVADLQAQPRVAFNDWFAPPVLARVRDILSAPIHRQHGTLHSIEHALSLLVCRDVFGKTGTTDSVDPTNYRDKLVIVGGTCKGRKIIAFGLVGSPDIRVPIGKVTTSQLARLVTDAISITLKEGNRK